MKRVKNKVFRSCLVFGLLIYFLLPMLAGFYEIGNLHGPKIYPERLHRELFQLGWEMTGGNGGGPRVPFDNVVRENRPWFYSVEK